MHKQDDNVNHVEQRRGEHRDRVGGAAGDQVLDLVHRVMHQVRSQQYQVLRDGPHDITHMESKVLGFVGSHPGATQSAMAQHSGRDKAQLARLIKGLRERGLLAATAGEDDRRSVRLSLTPDGQAVLRTLQQQVRRVASQAVKGFDAAEQQQLLSLLQRLQQNLDA
jgi:DNA-binding MarR family transcriptional regulator